MIAKTASGHSLRPDRSRSRRDPYLRHLLDRTPPPLSRRRGHKLHRCLLARAVRSRTQRRGRSSIPLGHCRTRRKEQDDMLEEHNSGPAGSDVANARREVWSAAGTGQSEISDFHRPARKLSRTVRKGCKPHWKGQGEYYCTVHLVHRLDFEKSSVCDRSNLQRLRFVDSSGRVASHSETSHSPQLAPSITAGSTKMASTSTNAPAPEMQEMIVRHRHPSSRVVISARGPRAGQPRLCAGRGAARGLCRRLARLLPGS